MSLGAKATLCCTVETFITHNSGEAGGRGGTGETYHADILTSRRMKRGHTLPLCHAPQTCKVGLIIRGKMVFTEEATEHQAISSAPETI